MIASQIAFLSLAIAPPPADGAGSHAQGVAMSQTAPALSQPDPGPPAAVASLGPASTQTTAPAAAPVATPVATPAPAADSPTNPVSPAAPGAAVQITSTQNTSPQNTLASTAPATPDTAATPTPSAPIQSTPNDPFERFNRASFAFSQPFDHYLLRPVAMVYKHVVPHVLRDGVRNFLTNLISPVIFLNDVLQFRPKRAAHTAERFFLNTSLGIAGVFDVAKRHPFGIRAHTNGFGDTLGYYGIHAGPYLYLPIVGPADPRDIVGYFGDWFAQPRLLNRVLNPDKDKPLVRSKLVLGRNSMLTMIVGGVDQRAQNDEALKVITNESVDPYAALRSSFLQNRDGEIAALKAPDGTAPNSAAMDDPLRDPAETVSSAPQMGAPVPR